MISKELLSEVLNIEIIDYSIDASQVRINQLWHEDTPLNRELELFNTIYGCRHSINIYELAHKCKEWAVLNHYDFTIFIDVIEIYHLGSRIHRLVNTCQNDSFIPFDPFYDIKACQWILDNRE